MSEPVRECGPCTACCTVLGVPEFVKGTYTRCEHLCESGCGIYAERPGSCRTFECQWLLGRMEVDGAVDTDLRPDACGVIFVYQVDRQYGETYEAWEVVPGASAIPPARGIIRELEENFRVVVMTRGPDPETGRGHRRVR